MTKSKKDGHLTTKEATDSLDVIEQTIGKWSIESDLKGFQVDKKRKCFIPFTEIHRVKKAWDYRNLEE